MKKVLVSLGIMFCLASVASAATSGAIELKGNVPQKSSIQVNDPNGTGVDFADLGFSAYTNTIVGSIVLNSNNSSGFNLTFTSEHGYLAFNDTAGADEAKKIAYTVNLNKTAGTIPSGMTEPAAQVASTPIDGTIVGFTGTPATPVVDLTYDVRVSTLVKNGLVNGDYLDTLTITIANI